MPYEQYFNNISFKYPRDWSLLTGIFLECCLQLELKYFKASVHIRKNKQGPIYILYVTLLYVAISSVPQSCPTLCYPTDCSMPGFLVHHQPQVYSNSCPLSRWCHPTISSSVIPFSSHLQSFPASGAFQISEFFSSGGQNIGVSASTSGLPMNTQD